MKITDLQNNEINLFELRKDILSLDETHPKYANVILNGEDVTLRFHWSWGYMVSVEQNNKEIGTLNAKKRVWGFKRN